MSTKITLLRAILLALSRTFYLAALGISWVEKKQVTTSKLLSSPYVSAFPLTNCWVVPIDLSFAMFRKALLVSTPVPQVTVEVPIPQHRSQTLSERAIPYRICLRRSTPSYAFMSMILVAIGAAAAWIQLLLPKLWILGSSQ